MEPITTHNASFTTLPKHTDKQLCMKDVTMALCRASFLKTGYRKERAFDSLNIVIKIELCHKKHPHCCNYHLNVFSFFSILILLYFMINKFISKIQ
ncbi:hypothetical protein CHS0354_000839 [Potamilus streckersoni]|uniref:Uncharacterized protein n=1 Tax=Potamilus streckersoni TaxID=2493646 RepID=A0AAE0RUU1_9BIVA|nr:hypothetical protein CHS0354_000839 [Potamilus streckersoni]